MHRVIPNPFGILRPVQRKHSRTMKALKPWLIAAVVFAGIVTPFVVWQRTQAGLRDKTNSLQQQSLLLTELSDENQRLSNQLAEAKRTWALTTDQESELLKLRGEIGQLRRAATETEKLRTENQKLLAKTAAANMPSTANVQSTADYWVKDQLTYSGFESPEAALKTALWAARTGDVRAMFETMTPEAREAMVSEWKKDGKSDDAAAAELKAMGESLAAPSSAFRLLDEQMKSSDEMVANVSFEGEGKARRFILRKVGSEWKIERMLFPGEN